MNAVFPSARQAIFDRRILIIDDEPRNVLLLTRTLETAGFLHIESTTDSPHGLALCLDDPPDLLILDLNMPTLDGYQLMETLGREWPKDVYIPILVLTADADERARRRALSSGARDFLTKPFGLTEAVLRIRNLLETRELHERLEIRNRYLVDVIAERTRELEASRIEVLERLSEAVEWRDDITGRHTRRVGELSSALARAFGLRDEEVDLIRRAAPLHDVGKIAVPDAILQKPGKLSSEEFSVMQQHTVIGGRILGNGLSSLMIAAEQIARCHHERWDGGGYPAGMSGTEIPVLARIVSIADVFDALTHARQYRDAWPRDRVVATIRQGAGREFDAAMVEAFIDDVLPGLDETHSADAE